MVQAAWLEEVCRDWCCKAGQRGEGGEVLESGEVGWEVGGEARQLEAGDDGCIETYQQDEIISRV